MVDYGPVEERVARGLEWLDSNVEGWVDKVEINSLRMASSCNCVLGQVFKEHERVDKYNPSRLDETGYGWAMREHNIEDIMLGFDFAAVDAEEIGNDGDPYTYIQEEWERVIAERKLASPTGDYPIVR